MVAGQEKQRFVLLLLGVGYVAVDGGGASGVAANESDEEASGERRVASAASHGAHQLAAHALGQSAVERLCCCCSCISCCRCCCCS